MFPTLKSTLSFFFFVLLSFQSLAQSTPREKLLMDKNWRFNFGHVYEAGKDFNYGTGYFSSFAKAGYGDGPAAFNFDDRAWRTLDLPHDWAVEAPFSSKGSLSHGFKAIGRNFPERSIGWYRKTFSIPSSDQGKKLFIEFDGVFRNSMVWINGHYLGVEPSGYSSFRYDLTDYLNFGGTNTVAVRVDATMEEGWFYEGAGIYRHVWLLKTEPLHVDYNGTFVSTEVKSRSAGVKISTTVLNDGVAKADFTLKHTILDAEGNSVTSIVVNSLSLSPGETAEYSARMDMDDPTLWSLENPYLYKVLTTISSPGKTHDVYETSFGVRTIRWDPDKGFFLNDKHVQLKGTNNHQDHAGVGSAIPDELQRFRILKLKEMGCNAYRCSHNPPTPELLKACDELGMLVIDENRLMGTSEQNLEELRRLMLRDRNHPSVILWSLGNEEWSMEGTDRGARIARTMRDYARRLDSTRLFTVAISGGWGQGISTAIDVMGYNYISHGNTDQQHKDFPLQAGVGTEEGATFSTRGVYRDDKNNCHLNAYDWDPSSWGASAEEGWSYYNSRDYLAGMFIWSGFDYRGEPTPFAWPAIASQFGVLDLCGFPKDNSFYYKAWWTNSPMVHLFPHWNWSKGDSVNVWAYSNCDEVELFLNGKSMGRKKNKKDSHVQWDLTYTRGTISAKGYIAGKAVISEQVSTTGKAVAVKMQPHKAWVNADAEDLAIVAVSTIDEKKRFVPDNNDQVTFTIQGPGKIIGVGNGDPSSHEADKYFDEVSAILITDWKVKAVESAEIRPDTEADFDDSIWAPGFTWEDGMNKDYVAKIYRGKFDMPTVNDHSSIRLFLHSVGEQQNIYVNGKEVRLNLAATTSGHEIMLERSLLQPGGNFITIIATPLKTGRKGGESPASIQVSKPPGVWKRSLFNGLAQVIIRSTGEPGDIILRATSGSMNTEIKISSKAAAARAAVE